MNINNHNLQAIGTSNHNLCTPTLLEAHRRRRSSTRSFFDEEKKCMICRKPSTCSTAVVALTQMANNSRMNTKYLNSHPIVLRHYRSYSQRWFVLATVCLLALSNATQWISFAPLHDATTAFYCNKKKGPIFNYRLRRPHNHTTSATTQANSSEECDVEYWTSQIFQIVGVLTGLFGMFVTDRYGIRVSCFCGSILNFLGAVIRVISSVPQIPITFRLPILYTGQTIAATSQPFFLCLSPKVAEYWFAENQRALANALSFIANPFGVVIGSVAPVIFVNTSLLLLAALVVGMSFGVRSSRAPIFYVQMVTFGMALALQWSIFITADKMLTKLDYVDQVSNYLLALSALSGSVASILAGYFVDRSKMFKEIIKSCYIGAALVAIALNIFLRHPKQSGIDTLTLVILLFALGFFAIPVFPISLELGVETTFPVAEATSSGILIIAGQLLLFLTTFVMQCLESVDWIYGKKIENFQLSIDFWTFAAVFSAIFSCMFLWPRYHRLEYEENVTFFSNSSPALETPYN